MATLPPVVPGSGRVLPDTRMGTITIGGIQLVNAFAWTFDVRPFWRPATQRGSDRILPGAIGVLALQRYETVTKLDLQGVLVGFVDHTAGSLATDRFATLQANFDYLHDQLVVPTYTGDGTRAAVLTMPDASTRTGNVHVIDLVPGNQADAAMLVTLTVEVPGGRLR